MRGRVWAMALRACDGSRRFQSWWLRSQGKARQRRGHDAAFFGTSYQQALTKGGDSTDFGRVFFAHDGRSVWKWTHYLPAYDEQLQRFRQGFPLDSGGHRPLRVLELGVFHGGSLQLWREYFGPEASIWGIDFDPSCKAVDDPDLEVRIGSQTDADFLHGVVAEMRGVDIVIDDGSHQAKDQRASFEILFPMLADGGLYVVEDTHTSFWRDFGGGYRSRSSFISLTKDLIDDMHSWYHSHRPKSSVDAKLWIPKVTIYDSMVCIQKMARVRPTVVRFGEESW